MNSETTNKLAQIVLSLDATKAEKDELLKELDETVKLGAIGRSVEKVVEYLKTQPSMSLTLCATRSVGEDSLCVYGAIQRERIASSPQLIVQEAVSTDVGDMLAQLASKLL